MRSSLAALSATKRVVAERTVRCSDGLDLQHWPHLSAPSATSRPLLRSDDDYEAAEPSPPTTEGGTATMRILCLHGHVDNSSSFHLLAPDLSDRLRAEILAPDFPGHGRSSHKSPDGSIAVMAEYAHYAVDAASSFGWDRYALVGHSMGAFVSVVAAAAFPDRVDRVVLLEGGTPLYSRDSDVSRRVRSAIERRIRSNRALYDGRGRPSKSGAERRIYPDLAAAVDVRLDTVKLLPGGHQRMSREAAEALVRRSTVPAADRFAPDGTGGDGTAVVFGYDPRIQLPMLQDFSLPQLRQLYRDVQCPVCRITAEDGWPYDRRYTAALNEELRPLVLIEKTLPGSHHFHADPETAGEVAEVVANFLEERWG